MEIEDGANEEINCEQSIPSTPSVKAESITTKTINRKKKEAMWKKIDPKHIKIHSVSQPEKNKNANFKNIKYSLRFTFENVLQPGKLRDKTVRLGTVKEKDLIDLEDAKT